MPIEPKLLSSNAFLGAASLSAYIGINSRPDINSEYAQRATTSSVLADAGIAATTTAAVLFGAQYAASRNPASKLAGKMGPVGAAITMGGAYATTKILSYLNIAKENNGEEKSVIPSLVSGAAGLSSLYHFGKASMPYVSRGLSSVDAQAGPWLSAFGRSMEQAQLKLGDLPGTFNDFKNMFRTNLSTARNNWSATQASTLPIAKYLRMYNSVVSSNLDSTLRGTVLDDITKNLIKIHGNPATEVTNGLRQATLYDLARAGTFINKDMGNLVTAQAELGRQGIDLRQVSAGRGVMFDVQNDKILNLSKFSPTHMFQQSILSFERNFKLPVAGFNPITIFRPREIMNAFNQGHAFHYFPKGSPLSKSVVAGEEGAFFIGKKLYDVATKKELPMKGFLLKTGSWSRGEVPEFRETAFGSAARMFRGFNPRETVGSEIDLGHRKVYRKTGSYWSRKVQDWLEWNTNFEQSASIGRELKDVMDKKQKPVEALKSLFNVGSMEANTAVVNRNIVPGSTASVFPTMHEGKGSAFAFMPFSELPEFSALWLTNRPVRLLEQLGLGGFDPRTTRSATDVMKKILLKRFLPIYTSWKMLQFGNDMSNALFGAGPIELAASGLAGLNVGSAYLRDAIGLTSLAQYIEGLMPGSMTSSASALLRGAGMPLTGLAVGGKRGLIAGSVISAILGGFGGDITKTGKEKKEEYFGNKRVPIRQGRWWMFGSTPFEGSKVKEFVPNWYRRLMSRYQFTDVQYGSEFEYWSNILSPFHYAKKHYYDRPYPIATTGIEEIPFVGSLLAPLAPQITMHDDYMQGGGGSLAGGFGGGIIGGSSTGGLPPTPFSMPAFIYGQPTGTFGLGGDVAGMPESNIGRGAVNPYLGGLPPPAASTQGSPSVAIGETIYRANEYLGLYGFAMNAIKENITGEENWFTQPQLESANRISSPERSYWEEGIGDPFGFTEEFRRFLPHRRREISLINPIPNTMPSWMPGDEYFTNFRRGDPFSKIDFGEIRLPGAGYEKFYTPGAGIKDATKSLGDSNLGIASGYKNYSMLDMYRILGDVAPYSGQYKYAKAYMGAMSKAGMLTDEGEEERKEVAREVTLKKRKYDFSERRFTEGDLAEESLTVGAYLGNGKFTAEGQEGIFQLAGVKKISDEGEEYLSGILSPGNTVSAQTLDDERYRTKNLTVPTTPVLLGDVNRHMVSSGMAELNKTGPGEVFAQMNTKVQYGPIARAVGGLWEDLSHSNIPYLQTKFLHNRTAIEEWERTQLYGRDSGSWSHPIRDFLVPMMHSLRGGGVLGSTIIGGGLGWITANDRPSEEILAAATKAAAEGAFHLGPYKKRILTSAAGGLIGAGLAVAGAMMGSAIPNYRNKEWQIDQYYDIMKYIKNRALYSQARAESIAQMGVDPEKIMESVEASRSARRGIADELKRHYGSLGTRSKQTDNPSELKNIAEERNAIQEQLQTLQYQKWTEDQAIVKYAGTPVEAAFAYRQGYQSTMYGADVRGDFANIMRALPNKQREFFQAFVQAPADERKRILSATPLGMRRFLEAKWGMDVEANPDLETYFKEHKLPAESWVGWHPGVNLEDVKLKTVKNEGFDMHDFNMWREQAASLSRKPYVPLIDPFSNSGNPGEIKAQIADIMKGQGYNKYEVSVIPYASIRPGVNLDMDIQYGTNPEALDYIENNLDNITDPAYG